MSAFYDRDRELAALQERWDAAGAQLALLYGRRRVGKTYLLQHFLQGRRHAFFLASQTTLQDNTLRLAETVLAQFPESGLHPRELNTINSILRFVSTATHGKRFALVLDEFQYLQEQDPSLASQIQNWWDTDGLRGRAFLILCGSQMGIMESLGGPQAPLFGRFTFRYKLPPMGYRDIACFYADSDYSARDKLAAYAVLGGTPRYHAALDPTRSLAENICGQVVSPLGLLHNEPEVLLLSSQIRDPSQYNATLGSIAAGCTRFNEISQRTGATSPQLTYHLRTLSEMQWVRKERPFGDRTERRAIWRISDNFLAFWYRFIGPHLSRTEFQEPMQVYASVIEPYLNEYVGRNAFEGICIEYLQSQGPKVLGEPISEAGRYWSRDGSVEIDIVARTNGGRLLVGECKWTASPLGTRHYYQLREKAALLPPNEAALERVHALFGLAGFDEQLRATAARDGVILVSGEDLLA